MRHFVLASRKCEATFQKRYRSSLCNELAELFVTNFNEKIHVVKITNLLNEFQEIIQTTPWSEGIEDFVSKLEGLEGKIYIKKKMYGAF